MEHLTILDFTTGDVDIYPIEYEQEPDMVNSLMSLGIMPMTVSGCLEQVI